MFQLLLFFCKVFSQERKYQTHACPSHEVSLNVIKVFPRHLKWVKVSTNESNKNAKFLKSAAIASQGKHAQKKCPVW